MLLNFHTIPYLIRITKRKKAFYWWYFRIIILFWL